MALEWPDLEAEQKKKAKVRRQSKKEGFIVKDSDEDSDDFRPRKQRKECRCFLCPIHVLTDVPM